MFAKLENLDYLTKSKKQEDQLSLRSRQAHNTRTYSKQKKNSVSKLPELLMGQVIPIGELLRHTKKHLLSSRQISLISISFEELPLLNVSLHHHHPHLLGIQLHHLLETELHHPHLQGTLYHLILPLYQQSLQMINTMLQRQVQFQISDHSQSYLKHSSIFLQAHQ